MTIGRMAKERTFTDEEVTEALAALPGWYLENGWIRRVYKTEGWPITLMLVNAIAFVAEAANHHPDLSVTWARVTVKLTTHSAGGITQKDFDLARRIEEVVLWRPAPEAEHPGGAARKFVRGDTR